MFGRRKIKELEKELNELKTLVCELEKVKEQTDKDRKKLNKLAELHKTNEINISSCLWGGRVEEKYGHNPEKIIVNTELIPDLNLSEFIKSIVDGEKIKREEKIPVEYSAEVGRK